MNGTGKARAWRTVVLLPLVCALPALGADLRTKVTVRTLNDDLRAGSSAWFVLRMADGREQSVPVTASGERLADNSRKDVVFTLRAPYSWGDVRDVGLRFRPDRGGGMRQADDWRMSYELHTEGCSWEAPPAGKLCAHAVGSSNFEGDRGEQTSWTRLSLSGSQCSRDIECDTDALFCNEQLHACRPSAVNSSVRVCARVSTPIKLCGSQACDEAEKRCGAAGCRDDADGDGVVSVACQGTDCDDTDRNRFPGNPEICDANGRDEDCDFSTLGDRDLDGDGFVDARCWNDVTQGPNRSVPGKN